MSYKNVESFSLDYRPASQLTGHSDSDTLLLILTKNDEEIRNLKEDVSNYCGN